jgi:pilus assembly protein CpaB
MILRKTKLIVYLAIIFSFLASLSVFLYLRGISVDTPVTTELYKDIVVVAVDMESGVRLTEEHVKILSWPERLVPDGSFEKPEDVVGKVVSRNFFSGEPVLNAHLAKEGGGDGIASLTPPGMRAMTVSLSSNAMINDFLNPASRVDVLATIKTERKGGGYISKSILQNIKVLSVNNGEGGGGGGGLSFNKGSSVTLLVTPEEAERLALAESQGILYLVLRNIADKDPLVTEGATISSLLGVDRNVEKKSVTSTNNKGPTKEKTSTTASRRRSQRVRIEVIRGMEREEMVFDNP